MIRKKQMAAEIAAPFTDEQLHGEEVSKKDIATFIQANASEQVRIHLSGHVIIITNLYMASSRETPQRC